VGRPDNRARQAPHPERLHPVPNTPGIGVELNEEACKAHLRIPGYFEPTPQYDKYILDEFRTGGPYPHLDENGKLVVAPDE